MTGHNTTMRQDDNPDTSDQNAKTEPEGATDGGRETTSRMEPQQGSQVVADYVAATHADHPDGVPHAWVIRYLLFELDRSPETADAAINRAVEDGLIHSPEAKNHYRPPSTSNSSRQ